MKLKETKIFIKEKKLQMYDFVNFVAIKNGKHDMNGKLYISGLDIKKI